ncbi:MAG TPA: alpha/beta hydrolase, partial [Actinomycetota bacterium]|nr:alpha/beta hydrolase [Actinomycetota bacterium]
AHPEMIEMTVARRDDEGSTLQQVNRQWGAILSFSSWDRLSEIQVPTLVVHGADDALVPHGNGVNLAARIPGAELVTLEGVGHLVPLEAPGDTLRLIQRFFVKGA